MKSLFRLLATGLLLGSLAAVVVEWRTIAKLRREKQRMNQENEELFRLGKEQIEVEIGKRDKEIAQLRAQAQELPRLRGDVTQLRATAKDLEKLRAENQQIRAENQQLRGAVKSNATAAAQSAFDTTYHAKENWAFAGYVTPEATLQSMLWAMREGDLKSLLTGIAPNERARFEQQIAEDSEAKAVEGFKKAADKFKGFRVLERKTISDDTVELVFHPDNGQLDTANILVKRIGNEWKFADKP